MCSNRGAAKTKMPATAVDKKHYGYQGRLHHQGRMSHQECLQQQSAFNSRSKSNFRDTMQKTRKHQNRKRQRVRHQKKDESNNKVCSKQLTDASK
jgi:hypothetical protein